MYIFTLFSLFLQYHYHRTSKIDIIENWYVYISYLYIHFIFNIKYINIIIPYELRNLYLYTCIYVYISYLYIHFIFNIFLQYHYHMNFEIDTIYIFVYIIYVNKYIYPLYFQYKIHQYHYTIWTPKLVQLYICIFFIFSYSVYFQYISSIPLPYKLRNWYKCIYVYICVYNLCK
jgi:hypothetical protein